ncbi:MAG: HigA family addiction module antitoxin [Acidiferrobacterales bacterium]
MANQERKPFSPGEILKEEFMEPLGLTQEELAKRLGISRRRINEVIRGHREITPDTALRLSKAFRVSPELWLNLQQRYNLWLIAHDPKKRKQYLSIKPIKAKAA